MPSFPTPVYLARFDLAFLRSARILSTSPRSSTISFARLRTVQKTYDVENKKSVGRVWGGKKRTIDALVLALIVDVVEVPKHFDGANVRAGVVHDALAAVFDDVLKKLERLQKRKAIYKRDASTQKATKPLPCRSLSTDAPPSP
jgi:ribosome-associated translation inhibitor RaiA